MNQFLILDINITLPYFIEKQKISKSFGENKKYFIIIYYNN
jgi:hypothetical protein